MANMDNTDIVNYSASNLEVYYKNTSNDNYFNIQPNTTQNSFVFYGSGGVRLGRLFENSGTLNFEGNVSESANLFFKEICRLFNSGVSRHAPSAE